MKKMQQPVRLYWGENYAPKPAIVKKALAEALSLTEKYLHFYPGELATTTKKLLAQKYQVKPSQVLVFNGIESLVLSLAQTFLKKGNEILTLSPTFVVYEFAASSQNCKTNIISVGRNTQITSQDMLSAITPQTKILFLAFPNTTTGAYHCNVKDIEAVLSAWSGLVVVDECYYGLGKKTVLPLLKKYPNLIILKSASKTWGLAGIRVGWCIASENNIQKLSERTVAVAMDPISLPSHLVLQSILPYTKLLEDAFLQHKTAFCNKLRDVRGVEIFPTDTTFLPIKLKGISPKEAIKKLARKNILVKDTSSLEYLLMGIPPKDQWEHVIQSLRSIVSTDSVQKDTERI